MKEKKFSWPPYWCSQIIGKFCRRKEHYQKERNFIEWGNRSDMAAVTS